MKIREGSTPVAQSRPAPALEQRSVKMEADAPLDQFSAEGWELIAVVPLLNDPSMVMGYFRRRRA